MSDKVITSYKGFDKNMQCRGFQYEVGKEYEMDGEIKCCNRGFHACKSPMEVWDYYDILNSRYAEVEQSAKIGSSGDSAKIGSSGDYAKIDSTGEDSVIMCAGNSSRAKAKVGSWITLAEWKWSDEKKRDVPVCVKTEYVDGENIKADTWYQLKNGKFVEV